MNNRLYPRIYIKNIFTLKKSSTFANLLTENQVLICYSKNVRRTPEEEILRKGSGFVLKISL